MIVMGYNGKSVRSQLMLLNQTKRLVQQLSCQSVFLLMFILPDLSSFTFCKLAVNVENWIDSIF